MNPVRLTRLERLVQSSLILLPQERPFWLQKLPSMTDEQLLELEDILLSSEDIDWSVVVPDHSPIMDKAVASIEQAAVELHSLAS